MFYLILALAASVCNILCLIFHLAWMLPITPDHEADPLFCAQPRDVAFGFLNLILALLLGVYISIGSLDRLTPLAGTIWLANAFGWQLIVILILLRRQHVGQPALVD